MAHHLTLTGPMAGTPYCGQSRNIDDEYSHLPYGTTEQVHGFVDNHVTCDRCVAMYDEIYRPDKDTDFGRILKETLPEGHKLI
jgi:hypothetical protein